MKKFHMPISMWITANNEAEARMIADNVESNLKDTLGHCPYDVSLEYHKDDLEMRTLKKPHGG